MTPSASKAGKSTRSAKPSDPSPADDASRANPFADLSYEEARERLVDVVRALETGGAPLEETLTLWESGEALADVCQARLDGARERLERATDQH